MTPDRSQSDAVVRVANKVRVEGGPFNPYLYVPKYRSSDALPTPEIFKLSNLFLFFKKKKEKLFSANVSLSVINTRSIRRILHTNG